MRQWMGYHDGSWAAAAPTRPPWNAGRGFRIRLQTTVTLCSVQPTVAAQTVRSVRLLLGPVALLPVDRVPGHRRRLQHPQRVRRPEQDFTFTTQPQLRVTAPVGSSSVDRIGVSGPRVLRHLSRASSRSIDGSTAASRVPASECGRSSRPRSTRRVSAPATRSTRACSARTSASAGGAELKLTGITSLTGAYRHTIQEYGDDERFVGVALGEQLDHTTDVASAGARLAITPLTTVVVDLELQRDRFDTSELS